MTKLKNSNATFWVIFKHCEKSKAGLARQNYLTWKNPMHFYCIKVKGNKQCLFIMSHNESINFWKVFTCDIMNLFWCHVRLSLKVICLLVDSGRFAKRGQKQSWCLHRKDCFTKWKAFDFRMEQRSTGHDTSQRRPRLVSKLPKRMSDLHTNKVYHLWPLVTTYDHLWPLVITSDR